MKNWRNVVTSMDSLAGSDPGNAPAPSVIEGGGSCQGRSGALHIAGILFFGRSDYFQVLILARHLGNHVEDIPLVFVASLLIEVTYIGWMS